MRYYVMPVKTFMVGNYKFPAFIANGTLTPETMMVPVKMDTSSSGSYVKVEVVEEAFNALDMIRCFNTKSFGFYPGPDLIMIPIRSSNEQRYFSALVAYYATGCGNPYPDMPLTLVQYLRYPGTSGDIRLINPSAAQISDSPTPAHVTSYKVGDIVRVKRLETGIFDGVNVLSSMVAYFSGGTYPITKVKPADRGFKYERFMLKSSEYDQYWFNELMIEEKTHFQPGDRVIVSPKVIDPATQEMIDQWGGKILTIKSIRREDAGTYYTRESGDYIWSSHSLKEVAKEDDYEYTPIEKPYWIANPLYTSPAPGGGIFVKDPTHIRSRPASTPKEIPEENHTLLFDKPLTVKADNEVKQFKTPNFYE